MTFRELIVGWLVVQDRAIGFAFRFPARGLTRFIVAEVTDVSLYTSCAGPILQRVPKRAFISLGQGPNLQAESAYRHRESYCITSHMLCIRIYVPSVSGILDVCRYATVLMDMMLDKGIVAHRTATIDTGCSRLEVSTLCVTKSGTRGLSF